MALISDLIEAKRRRALYVNAEIAILDGAQEYTIDNRSLRRPDLKYIASTIEQLTNEIRSLESGGIQIQAVVPCDQ